MYGNSKSVKGLDTVHDIIQRILDFNGKRDTYI